MPGNGVGNLADGKPWISIQLSRNRLAMLRCVIFLALGLSTNILLMLLISWLCALYTQGHFES